MILLRETQEIYILNQNLEGGAINELDVIDVKDLRVGNWPACTSLVLVLL